MATVDEFRQFIKDMPDEIEESKLSQDALYDSIMMSGKLTESSALGEIDDVLLDVSDETKALIGTQTYSDATQFYPDYSKIPLEDRRRIENALAEKDSEAVESAMIDVTAKRMSESLDLTQAKEFLASLDEAQFKVKDIKDRKFQQAMFASDKYDVAVRLNDLHRNYDKVCQEFNAKWAKQFESKVDKGIMSPLRPEESEVPLTANLNDFSNETIAKIPKTDTEKINYEAAKASYLNAKYNYPLDYVQGTPTDMGYAEGQIPFIAAALTAGFAPVSGPARAAYGISGGLLDSPLTTGVEEIVEGVGKYSMPLGVASSVAAVMLLGPMAEGALARIVGGTARNMFIKPGNTLTKMLKFSQWDDLKLSDDMYSAIDSIISTKQPTEFKRLLPNLADTDDGMEAAYKAPQSMYNDNPLEVVEITAKDPSRAKLEMTHLEHNNAKGAVKEELDRREFLSHREQVKYLLSEDDVDGALAVLGTSLDEAVDTSHRILDSTQDLISNPKTNIFHQDYLGIMPESMQGSALYDPNVLIHLEQGFQNVAAQFPKHIKQTLGPYPKHTRLFNSIINRLDNGELKYDAVLESSETPVKVKQALATHRKYNDYMYDLANKHYSDIMNRDGIRQYSPPNSLRAEGANDKLIHVNILRSTDDGVEVRDIRSQEVFMVSDPADLKSVKEAIPYRENFMHRHLMDNSWAVSIKPKGQKSKVLNTAKHGLSAYNLKRELINTGVAGKDEIIVHRIKDNPDQVASVYGNRSMVGVPKGRIEETINDSDALNQMLLDTGMMDGAQRVEFVDELVDMLGKEYGITNVKKAKYPNGVPSKHRTRMEALAHVADPLDSMNAYSKMVGRTLIEGEYSKKWKADFLKHYGEVLENPTDYTSKIDLTKLDLPKYQHLNKKVIKLYQNQLMNYSRTPHPTVVKVQRNIDNVLHKMYGSNSKAMHGAGRLLELQNKHLPLVDTVKAISYSQALAFNSMQALLQSTWLHYGLTKNLAMYAESPGKVLDLGAGTTKVGQKVLTNQMGIKSPIALSLKDQLRVKMIEDYGMVSNILGTEGGTSGGLLQGMHSVSMAPVAGGEFVNRIGNIVNTSMKAEAEGLKLGTKEHALYVAKRFPRDAQVLNQMTNTPLTTSMWTSWNVGLFKKFQLQALDAFWQGTTWSQRAGLAGLGYVAFGKYGVPGAAEPAFLLEQMNEVRSNMALTSQISVAAAAENITLEEAYEYIDSTYDNEEWRSKMKADLLASKEARDSVLAEVGNLKVQELLKDRADPDREPTAQEIFMGMVSYEGYFDNALINVGYRSVLEQASGYGLWGMSGPFVQSVKKADFMSPMYHLHEAMTKYTSGEGTLEDMSHLASQEVKKLWSALHPASSKKIDVKLQIEELMGAVDRNELTDQEGNLLGWTDLWKNPTLQFNLDYKEQTPKQLTPRTVSSTTSMSELFMRILGGEGGRIRDIKKADRDKWNYVNKILVPSIERMADLYDMYVSEGDVDFANQLFYTFSRTEYHKWAGTPMYPEIMSALSKATAKYNARRTLGATPTTEYKREQLIELRKDMEGMYDVR